MFSSSKWFCSNPVGLRKAWLCLRWAWPFPSDVWQMKPGHIFISFQDKVIPPQTKCFRSWHWVWISWHHLIISWCRVYFWNCHDSVPNTELYLSFITFVFNRKCAKTWNWIAQGFAVNYSPCKSQIALVRYLFMFLKTYPGLARLELVAAKYRIPISHIRWFL